jgi:hypothetical protein
MDIIGSFDNTITGLLSLSFIIFCFIIHLGVYAIRKSVEFLAQKIAHIFPDKYEPFWQWLWREVILPGLPLITGAILAYFVAAYPFPEPFNISISGRIFFGIFSGLASGYVYPRVMYYIKKLKENPE